MEKHLIDTLLDLIGFKSQVEKIANDEKKTTILQIE